VSTRSLVLSFGRCAWGKCVFCGYGRIFGAEPNATALEKVFKKFFAELPAGTAHVKVFGSGSFLDEKQVPAAARKSFVNACRKAGIKEVTVESRPEFITASKLKDFKGIKFHVAVGLETACNDNLELINKGFKVEDFEAAASIIHEAGGLVRAYLLANIPGVKNVKKDLDSSVTHALKFSDSVVVINLLPHGNTPLVKRWLSGEWTFLGREEFERACGKWRRHPKVELDEETFRFTPKIPKSLQENLTGVGERYLSHPHFEVWQDWLARWYQPPENRALLFLPCSKTKPYKDSKTHRAVISALEESSLRSRVHEVMLSNAGVVPRELEDNYPFNAYDWDERRETPEVKARYVEVTAERIQSYLRVHKKYSKVACFLKHDSESHQALDRACKKLKVKFTNLLREETFKKIKKYSSPLQSAEALHDLSEGVKNVVG